MGDALAGGFLHTPDAEANGWKPLGRLTEFGGDDDRKRDSRSIIVHHALTNTFSNVRKHLRGDQFFINIISILRFIDSI